MSIVSLIRAHLDGVRGDEDADDISVAISDASSSLRAVTSLLSTISIDLEELRNQFARLNAANDKPFVVTLHRYPDDRIVTVVNIMHDNLGWPLKRCRAALQDLPYVLATAMEYDDAEKLTEELAGQGAVVHMCSEPEGTGLNAMAEETAAEEIAA